MNISKFNGKGLRLGLPTKSEDIKIYPEFHLRVYLDKSTNILSTIDAEKSLALLNDVENLVICQNVEELKKSIEKEKEEENSKIPYRFTILDKYPQYVVLAYIPKKEVVREFIKIKPRVYFFHHQYHYPFQNMINWFKQEFRSKDY